MHKIEDSNLKCGYLENPMQCGINYDYNISNETNEESIICGEVVLIKHLWRIQFRCGQCRESIANLELFLRHSLEHIYDHKVEDEQNQQLVTDLTTNATEQLLSSNEPECMIPAADPLTIIKTEEISIEDTCIHESQFDNSTPLKKYPSTEQLIHEQKTALVEENPEHLASTESTCYTRIVTSDAKPETIDEENTALVVGIKQRHTAVADDGNSKRKKTYSLKKEKKVYICEHCEKRFKFGRCLKAHLLIHSSDRPYKCDLCSAGFKDRHNLNVHRRRHLRIKPHKCDLCDKCFTTTTELKIHHRSHTGEKPFVCDKCGMAFITSSVLTDHMKRHTNTRPKVCPDCGKQFYNKTHLDSHIKVHTENRPHKCEICSASFKDRKTLQTHSKLHSKLFEYKCSYCEKAFQQNAGLHSHVKSVHGEYIFKNKSAKN